MIALFDGCYCSELQVHPKNWNQAGASVKKDWYIYYRFYDPQIRDAQDRIKPKLCIVKGMNGAKDLAGRRFATKVLVEEHFKLLQVEGFNQITGKYMAPVITDTQYEIDPSTPVIDALTGSMHRLSVTSRVKIGIKCVIKGIALAACQLRYDRIEISRITRRHIKSLLEQCARNSERWSNTRFNMYRGYLMMLFKELVELEASPANPIRDISKRKLTKKIKEVLSTGDRTRINDHLANVFPRFQKFVHLFFHSGGRKTELLQLKPSMVDLKNQSYRCMIKKGRQYKEVDRTIKTIAIPFWKFFLQDCPGDHFIFGPLFEPGLKPIGQDMPTKYWKDYVKIDLEITADFYSLKHLNTSEVVDALDEKAAASLNAHSSTAMVVNIYDVKQKDRQHNRLKDVGNSFV